LYQMKTLRIIFGSFLDMSKPSKKQTGTWKDYKRLEFPATEIYFSVWRHIQIPFCIQVYLEKQLMHLDHLHILTNTVNTYHGYYDIFSPYQNIHCKIYSCQTLKYSKCLISEQNTERELKTKMRKQWCNCVIYIMTLQTECEHSLGMILW
jgi:hypothetical protein